MNAPGGILGDIQAAARDLVRQAAEAVDLSGVKEALEAIERGGHELAGDAVTAEVISAVPLTAEERTALDQRLKAQHGDDLPIHYTVDPALLGGLVVRVGDRMVDGSLAAKLNQLRQTIAG